MTKDLDYESSKYSENNLTQLKKPRILRRTWVILLACLASTIMVLLRYNLSVAIIAILEEDLPVSDKVALSNSNDTNVSATPLKRYPFSQLVVGQIMASYFYGTLFSGILSLLTPFFLEIHYIVLCIARFLIGSLHSTVLCCAYTLFSEWLPDSQKSTAVTFMNVAFEVGGMLSFYLSGVITTNIGWKASFYIFSLTSFAWFVPFYFLCYSNPDSDPNLSEYERKLIEEERKKEYQNLDCSKIKLVKIPPKLTWKILLASPPVIASCFAKSAIGFVYYVITIEMPGYLHYNFNLPLEESGGFTSIAEGACFFAKLLCLPLAGYVFRFKFFSLTTKRKIFQSLAMLLPAIGFLIITFKNDNKALDIFLLCLAFFGIAFVCLGDAVMLSEFSKDLAGSLFGWTNTFATLQGVLTPIITSAILDAYPDQKGLAYNYLFYITVIFLLVSWLIFLLFATSEVQPWSISQFVPANEKKEKKNQNIQSINDK